MTLDMTQGKPSRLLLQFAFPLMLSQLLQQCYSFCDTLLVGRFLGSVALTAAGSAGGLSWIPQNLVCCAIYAYGVALSHRFGAKDKEGFRRFFAGALVLATGLGVVVTAVGVIFARNFLMLLDTPEELLPLATTYLQILWAGFLFTALMNLFSTALTSLGDSKTPLVSLAISSVVNIVLDIVFLTWLDMGIGGAALATVLAQVCSTIWNLLQLIRKREVLPQRRHFRLQWNVMKELLRLSLPQMLSSTVINSGGLLVQRIINSYGVEFVMGINGSGRIFSMLYVVGYGLELAVLTYTGQNWGAGHRDRIRSGVRFSVLFGFISSALIGTLVSLLAEPLIRFLLADASDEVIRIGTEALRVQGLFLPGMYLLCEFRAAIQGMGNAIYPMLSGFSELAMRILACLLLPLALGQAGLYFVDAAAWIPTMLLMVIGYYAVLRKDAIKS